MLDSTALILFVSVEVPEMFQSDSQSWYNVRHTIWRLWDLQCVWDHERGWTTPS